MEEIWKKIEGYEKYSVSNYGRVRNDNKNLILKPEITRFGYYRVLLKGKHIFVHQLVARAFIPYTGLNPDGTEIKGRVEVNHKSEIKTDNRVENLEWCDRRYNVNYGTHNERVGRAQRKRILCIETNEIFFGMKEIYEKYKIPSSNISEICNCGKQKSAKGLHFRYIEED